MSRRGNRRRREDRRERPPPDPHPPSSSGMPTMSLADKMRSFYETKERQAKEANDHPLPFGAGSRGSPPSKST